LRLWTLPRGLCPSVYETKRGVPKWVWPYESSSGVKEFHRSRFGTAEEAARCASDSNKFYVYATATCVWYKGGGNNDVTTRHLKTLRHETEVDSLRNRNAFFVNLYKTRYRTAKWRRHGAARHWITATPNAGQ